MLCLTEPSYTLNYLNGVLCLSERYIWMLEKSALLAEPRYR